MGRSYLMPIAGNTDCQREISSRQYHYHCFWHVKNGASNHLRSEVDCADDAFVGLKDMLLNSKRFWVMDEKMHGNYQNFMQCLNLQDT